MPESGRIHRRGGAFTALADDYTNMIAKLAAIIMPSTTAEIPPSELSAVVVVVVFS